MNVKLYYFDAKGRGELIRLILHAGKQQFEDIRIKRELWSYYKTKMPFNRVPVLEVDGIMIPESNPIARYAAHICNLAGSTDLEKAQADVVVTVTFEYREQFFKILSFSPEDEKKESLSQFATESVSEFLEKMDLLMKAYGSPGHFVKNSFTWADIAFYSAIECFSTFKTPDLSAYPDLEKCIDLVKNVEGVKQYLETRKETDY